MGEGSPIPIDIDGKQLNYQKQRRRLLEDGFSITRVFHEEEEMKNYLNGLKTFGKQPGKDFCFVINYSGDLEVFEKGAFKNLTK